MNTADMNVSSALGVCGYTAFYQPIINLKDLNTVGFEALCRQTTPVALVEGSQVVSDAKNLNMLSSVDMFMTDLQVKVRKGLKGSEFITSNVSVRTLVGSAFIKLVEKMDVHGQSLVLEITETEELRPNEFGRLKANIDLIRSRGWSIALDDFGDGHGGLRYLNTLDIDIVKISRNTLLDLMNSDNQRIEGKKQFVRDLIKSLSNQKIVTVMEGIETTDQLELAKFLGSDYAQGFLFGKPTNDNAPGKIASQLIPRVRTAL